MDHRTEDLETALLDELGIDIYSPFGQERHFLTPDVLHEIFIGLVVAYLAGFLGLEALGRATRQKLKTVVEAVRAGASLGGADAEITRLFDDARRHRAGADAADRRLRAAAQLAAALEAYGMSASVASAHATAMAALITDEIGSEPGGAGRASP
jgi:hypothetical protein